MTTVAQEHRRRLIERRLRRAVRDLRDLAIEMGCKQPYLYYECEGQLHVIDEAHPSASVRLGSGLGSGQEAIMLSIDLCGRVVRAKDPNAPYVDCGAW